MGAVTDNTAMTAKIEAAIDKSKLPAMAISNEAGGLDIRSVDQAIEIAKLMSVSQQAVPGHCRNNPGICMAIVVQAIEWRMSPFAVANKSYVVNDRVAYESQLIHAVVEQRAPLTGRLRHSFSGDGENRKCKVWATARGETEPLVYESPPISRITPKNSPLWKSKPDLQLFYNTSRDWARMYFPDVIMGVYSQDELLDAHPSSTFLAERAPPSLAAIAAQVTAGIDTRQTVVEPPQTTIEPVDAKPVPTVEQPQESPPASQTPDRPMGDLKAFRAAADACKTLAGLRKLQQSVQWPDEDHELMAAQICDEAADRIKGTQRDLLP